MTISDTESVSFYRLANVRQFFGPAEQCARYFKISKCCYVKSWI